MVRPQQGWRWLIVLALVGAFLTLQWMASRLQAPNQGSEVSHARQPFAIDLTLPTLQGSIMRLSELRGQVVLLNFWATWCHPCRTEMPSMRALYQDYHDKGLEILAVASDPEGHEIVSAFAQAQALPFPILLDPDNVFGARLPVQGLPTSYILDKQGRVVKLELGARNWNSAGVRRLFDTLLSED